MAARNAVILLTVLAGNLCLIAACEDRLSRWVMAGLACYLVAAVFAAITRGGGSHGPR